MLVPDCCHLPGMTPTATGIAESALYVDDLDRALDFYLRLLGSEVIHHDERFCALRVAEEQTLLLFKRGATREDAVLPFGTIISHDGSGPLHICFGMAAGETGAWEARLKELGIPVESRVDWPNGASSLYFRDPDGHALELASPGLWHDFGKVVAAAKR